MAGTKLNICAILSLLKNHEEAADYAINAIKQIDLAIDERKVLMAKGYI
jgi:hypothetical protein